MFMFMFTVSFARSVVMYHYYLLCIVRVQYVYCLTPDVCFLLQCIAKISPDKSGVRPLAHTHVQECIVLLLLWRVRLRHKFNRIYDIRCACGFLDHGHRSINIRRWISSCLLRCATIICEQNKLHSDTWKFRWRAAEQEKKNTEASTQFESECNRINWLLRAIDYPMCFHRLIQCFHVKWFECFSHEIYLSALQNQNWVTLEHPCITVECGGCEWLLKRQNQIQFMVIL